MDTKKRKTDLVTAPIVFLQWVDAVADVEWQENVKAEVHLCHTIGWIIDETEDAICVANTVSMESSNARMHIPKQWIKSKKEINIETKFSQSEGKNIPAVGKRPVNSKAKPRTR